MPLKRLIASFLEALLEDERHLELLSALTLLAALVIVLGLLLS